MHYRLGACIIHAFFSWEENREVHRTAIILRHASASLAQDNESLRGALVLMAFALERSDNNLSRAVSQKPICDLAETHGETAHALKAARIALHETPPSPPSPNKEVALK